MLVFLCFFLNFRKKTKKNEKLKDIIGDYGIVHNNN